MNKKGSLSDTIYGPIYVLVIGITMFIAVYLWQQTSFSFLNMPITGTNGVSVNQSVTQMITNINPAFQSFDWVIPFVVGGLLIASTVMAFRRGASVLYIGLALIFWVLALLLSSVFSDIFTQFSSSSIFSTTILSFPILSWVMANMQWIVLGWLFVISVVMFSRNKREEQQLASAEASFM